MVNVDNLREQLINGLWLSGVREGGSAFYRRRRKNKQMRLFTLTNGINFKEITKLVEERLVQKEGSVAWVSTMMKRSRLESESLVESVFDGCVYDDAFLGSSCPLRTCIVPFDIINLDFSSQDPELENGRIEKEFKSLERAISFQNEKSGDKFVLIYTTLIDSNNIDKNSVVQTSNSVQVAGWSGLNFSTFSQPVSDSNDKKAFIAEAAKRLCEKYGYRNTWFNNSIHNIPSRQEQLYSVVGIFMR